MFKGYREKKAIEKANRVAQQGVDLKRRGRVNEAVALLEDYIDKNMVTKAAPPLAIAILYKSIGKLFYLQRQSNLAIQAYVVAISQLLYIDYVGEASTCAFHLGCCSDDFLRSKWVEGYYYGLQDGIGKPGYPDVMLFADEVQTLTDIGIEMFNKTIKEMRFPSLSLHL